MIVLEGVSVRLGGRPALDRVTLEVPYGATAALIGPSGCGKSTLLRALIGLVVPDAGRVRVDGVEPRGPALAGLRHRTGYVIQEGGLFPHLTAGDNVALLARHLRWPPPRIGARLKELAALARLDPSLLRRYPRELSGGQRQRVALMRALMVDPPLLLLDEPLGALDPLVRYQLQQDLRAIFSALRKTVLFVTHDLHEAAYFSDDLILLREGRVVQRGPVAELAARPADAFVTAFLAAQRGLLAT